MKTMIQALKGMRDYYPEEMAVRTFLYQTAREVSESFGYQEYDGPCLESIDLYAAKSGEELVKEQSFVFPDRGGDLITMRPELTPTLARMVAQRQRALAYPLRLWSWGPFWRYEKPQKGRTREFFQWNIDMLGVNSPEADAELIAIAATFLRRTGLSSKDVRILVNNRRLMEDAVRGLGVADENRKAVFRMVDRRDKMPPAQWKEYGAEIGLTDAQFEGLVKLLENNELWRQSDDMVRLFAALDALGVSEYVHYAPHIIRGLEYYTGTVFEMWDNKGEFRAVLGGGRYDNLVADVGGEPLGGVGFAMGDVVISLVLEKFGCLPQNRSASPAAVLVTLFDAATTPAALGLATQLRAAGLKTAVYPEVAKMGKQFKYGDRMGMKVAVVLGPDEQANSQVAIKDLRSGEQKIVPQAEMVETVRGMVES